MAMARKLRGTAASKTTKRGRPRTVSLRERYGAEIFEIVREENKGRDPEALTNEQFEEMLARREREKGVRYGRPE